MKIIFLDVDGVLNTSHSRVLTSLSKPLVRRLERIVKSTNSRIVLSSSWRKYAPAREKLARTLKYRWMSILDDTPTLHLDSPGAVRGDEIAASLEKYHPDRYAILDDDSDMLDWQLPNFFQTDPDYGLSETIAYRVIQHLGLDAGNDEPQWKHNIGLSEELRQATPAVPDQLRLL